ncbi:MAG: hypothetical protein IID45_04490 [Planctomycetes bacterium]|nr:hypothetical protein [Planctomycetota bacterium]
MANRSLIDSAFRITLWSAGWQLGSLSLILVLETPPPLNAPSLDSEASQFNSAIPVQVDRVNRVGLKAVQIGVAGKARPPAKRHFPASSVVRLSPRPASANGRTD